MESYCPLDTKNSCRFAFWRSNSCFHFCCYCHCQSTGSPAVANIFSSSQSFFLLWLLLPHTSAQWHLWVPFSFYSHTVFWLLPCIGMNPIGLVNTHCPCLGGDFVPDTWWLILCQLDWAMRVPSYLVEPPECHCEGVLDEVNIWMGRLSKADCPS